jgi:hypothetical protein
VKYKATILLCCLLAYLTELATLPITMGTVTHAATTQKTCCKSKTASNPSSSCKKEKDCNASTCCTSCPACYVTTLTSLSLIKVPAALIEKAYRPYQSHYDFLHSETTWKPPNAA